MNDLEGRSRSSEICGNHALILYHYWDSTFAVYVIACDLEMSFSFDTAVEIIEHVHALYHSCVNIFGADEQRHFLLQAVWNAIFRTAVQKLATFQLA